MKYVSLFFAVALLVVSSFSALGSEKGELLEDIVLGNRFVQSGIGKVVPLIGGEHYALLSKDRRKIDIYSFATGKKDETFFDLDKKEKAPEGQIAVFELSSDNTILLFALNAEKINRYSFKASYYTYNFKSKELLPLSDGKQLQATLSPNGEMVAFVESNNLYVKKLKFGTTTTVTKDGAKDSIINGVPDWVYEEEFKIVKAFEWSPDNSEIAFVKFNETKVGSYPLVGFNYLNNGALVPDISTVKYPKAGLNNSEVSVHIYNVKNRTTKKMSVGSEMDIYIPKIIWTRQPGKLAVLKLNRRQNELEVYIGNTASTVSSVVLTDRNDAYISEETLSNIQFLEDAKHFVYMGELDGYMHLYLYTYAGNQVRQITSGEFDVTAFYGVDESNQILYYQAAELSPLQRDLYTVRLDGKNKLKLSSDDGIHEAVFSKSYRYYINYFQNSSSPLEISIKDVKGKRLSVLKDNRDVKKQAEAAGVLRKEYFSFKTSNEVLLNGWMIKPKGFNSETKYPTLLVQYSGPNSQRVKNEWSVDWTSYLAEKGIVVVCVDGRGTGARGEEFRKCTYMKLGEYEVDDQIEAAKYLAKQAYVDADRLAIWGASFGGYVSCASLSRSEGLFKVGVAIAPVTDWRFYDSVYSERYMRKPQENPQGYKSTSLLEMADELDGRLFLIHGTADDNVHFSNTMNYVEALVRAEKQFDMFVYPNGTHTVLREQNKVHLYKMVTDYLLRNL